MEILWNYMKFAPLNYSTLFLFEALMWHDKCDSCVCVTMMILLPCSRIVVVVVRLTRHIAYYTTVVDLIDKFDLQTTNCRVNIEKWLWCTLYFNIIQINFRSLSAAWQSRKNNFRLRQHNRTVENIHMKISTLIQQLTVQSPSLLEASESHCKKLVLPNTEAVVAKRTSPAIGIMVWLAQGSTFFLKQRWGSDQGNQASCFLCPGARLCWIQSKMGKWSIRFVYIIKLMMIVNVISVVISFSMGYFLLGIWLHVKGELW